jgi:hypothetical protein
MKTTQTVKIYDVAAKAVVTIPQSELAPGMVEVFVPALGEKVWIDPHQVPPAPIRHPEFGEKKRRKLRKLVGMLKEVYPQTIGQWEDGFRRDAHPDAEIAIWLRLADIYRDSCRRSRLTPPQKMELFTILKQCSCSPYDCIRDVIAPESLPPETVTRAIEAYYGEPALKKLAARKPAIEYPDKLGNTPDSVEVLRTQEGRAVIKDVQVILGVDSFSGETNLFFGREVLENLAKTREGMPLSTVSFLYDSRTDQLQLLVAAVRAAKGWCCYGQR